MSEVVDEPFNSASEKVEEAYDQAVMDLKSKIERAKAAALKKVSS